MRVFVIAHGSRAAAWKAERARLTGDDVEVVSTWIDDVLSDAWKDVPDALEAQWERTLDEIQGCDAVIYDDGGMADKRHGEAMLMALGVACAFRRPTVVIGRVKGQWAPRSVQFTRTLDGALLLLREAVQKKETLR